MNHLKYILPLVLVFSLKGCSVPEQEEGKEISKEIQEQKIASDSLECFTEPDSSFQQTVLACSGSYYKLLNDEYVLKISALEQKLNQNCRSLLRDSSVKEFTGELIRFKKEEASLSNFCTDLILVGVNKPESTLNQCYGIITIRKCDSTNLYGIYLPVATIEVHELRFTDSDEKEFIIKDELLWKVQDVGTPG